MTQSTGQKLYERAKKRIPGGTQLLSKRPELFLPGGWPSYYQSAKGCEITDLDGRKYIDMSMNGIGTCPLGFADDDINAAVKEVIDRGSMSSLNCPEEVELADLLCELHPWADMARFARCGGESMAIAVRIARAATRRDLVVFCGYHGWNDWYLAANLSDDKNLDGHLLPGLQANGVVRALQGTALPFEYNHLASLEKIIAERGSQIAAVVMEPVRHILPAPGFLQGVKDLAAKNGSLLIFDEITSGFRMNAGGIHLLYDVVPDMAVFAKAMSNGFPMGAVIGNAKCMQSAQDTFISSTYWTEKIGPTAALATIKKYRQCNVHEHQIRIGELVQQGWSKSAERHGLKVNQSGIAPLAHFAFNYGDQNQALHTLFTQEMLKRGFLASKALYTTFAQKNHHIESYLESVDAVFATISGAISENRVKALLEGPEAMTGFKRLN